MILFGGKLRGEEGFGFRMEEQSRAATTKRSRFRSRASDAVVAGGASNTEGTERNGRNFCASRGDEDNQVRATDKRRNGA